VTPSPDRPPRIQFAAQYLSPGSGGIARCARLTLLALQARLPVSAALAVEDDEPQTVGNVPAKVFHGRRLAFAAANAAFSFATDLLFYDFPGTARAHRIIGRRKPYALWVHGLEIWPPGPRPDYARAIRDAKAVFANSRHTIDRLRLTVPGLANTHLCWLGTENDDTGSSAVVDLESRKNIVLFVGRNDEMFAKGQDILIAVWPEVVRRIPDAELHFVGGGTHLDHLRSLAAASPASASIRILGALPDRDVNALYRQAKIFAMPSEIEGFGLVYAEAMSRGVPVITSTNDAAQELNREGITGYSIDRNDRTLLVERMVAVLGDPGLHRTLATGALEHWRRNFTFSSFARRFQQAMAAAGLFAGPK
jgi:phosphatidylinositol alpha-1,6-mannosyltransferase